MILYRGTKNKVEVITAQKVHKDDSPKFLEANSPKKVVWASRNIEEALIHGLMDGFSYSISIEMDEQGKFKKGRLETTIPLSDLITNPSEKVYIYAFSSDLFTQVGNGPEYYFAGDIKEFNCTEYTAEEVINRLIEAKIEFNTKTPK